MALKETRYERITNVNTREWCIWDTVTNTQLTFEEWKQLEKEFEEHSEIIFESIK